MQQSVQSDVGSVALILADGKKVLRDGTVITEVPRPAVQTSIEIQSGRQAKQTLERMHRKLGELPDIPQKMNPVAAVIFYTCIGLGDADIAEALGATEQQIKTLKESELYAQLYNFFDKTIFDDAKRNAKHIIARASDHAATRIVEAIDSDDPLISLAASRDVMKFAGVSLEQESNTKLSGLQIRITRREDDADDISVEVK